MSGLNTIELDDGWALIQTGIDKLKNFLDNPDEPPQITSKDYMELYTTIFNLCTQNAPNDYSSELHERYKKVFEDYLTLTVVSPLSNKDGEILLKEFVRRWSNHKVMVQCLSRFFSYLDRYYLPDKNLPPLKEEGMVTFRNMVSDELFSNVRTAALSLIGQERDNGQIDLALLRNVVYTFVELGMGKLEYYENKFESFMIQETSVYYSQKVYEWSSQKVSCSDYMSRAEQCIQREYDRVCYLHPSSEAKLMEIVQNQLLSDNRIQWLENNLQNLLMDGKFDDLSKMYKLFYKVPKGLDRLCSVFEQVFIKKTIELHDKCHKYVNDCFKKDTLFRKAPRETLERLCNKDIHGSSGAELLAIFSDNVLKKDIKLSYEDIEHTLEKVVKLVEYLRDKDVFVEYYWEKLAQRLLFHESDIEHEKSIVVKLRQVHGHSCTRKLGHMLREFTEVSNERQSRLTNYLAVNTEVSPVIDLSLTLLNSAFWPTYKTADLKLPEEMVKSLDVFKGFIEHDEREQGQELPKKYTRAYSLDTCSIMVKFDEQRVELIVTTYQASALLLFNMSDRLSYKEIMNQLNLPADDVERILQSLSCASLKILIKEPDTDTFSLTDIFELNSKFTTTRAKFKLPLHPSKVNEKVGGVVDTERKESIDATIMRLMKSRKVLSHKQLLAECKEQLQHRFEPDVKVIKKRIEALIEREYLERDKADASKYRYMPAST